MPDSKRLCSRRTAAAILVAAATLSGCTNDLLEVPNPASIGTEYLEQITSIPALTNTVVSDFTIMFSGSGGTDGSVQYAGAILSDEAITGHNFTQWQEFDRRIVLEENSLLDNIYEPVQIARGTAELIIGRLRELVATPDADVRVAQSYAYLGYDYVMLAETFCEAPIVPKGERLGPDQLFQIAIAKFDTAIAIATAAKNDTTNVLPRADVISLARTGAARAALNMGNMTLAASYAALVPQGFAAYVGHSDANAYQTNPFYDATQGTNRNVGVSVHFRNIANDPRVRWETPRTGHNQRTLLYTPQPPPSHEGYSAAAANPTPGPDFLKGGNMRFASGLEAQYILAEAQGPTTANVDFINTRRAVGGMTPLAYTVSAADFRSAVMEQRRRDFYLDGHRLGDLRRYIKLYNIDQFPTGAHEDAVYGDYGTATCYIPHRDERLGQAP